MTPSVPSEDQRTRLDRAPWWRQPGHGPLGPGGLNPLTSGNPPCVGKPPLARRIGGPGGCSWGDLNPRPRVEGPLSLTGLDYRSASGEPEVTVRRRFLTFTPEAAGSKNSQGSPGNPGTDERVADARNHPSPAFRHRITSLPARKDGHEHRRIAEKVPSTFAPGRSVSWNARGWGGGEGPSSARRDGSPAAHPSDRSHGGIGPGADPCGVREGRYPKTSPAPGLVMAQLRSLRAIPTRVGGADSTPPERRRGADPVHWGRMGALPRHFPPRFSRGRPREPPPGFGRGREEAVTATVETGEKGREDSGRFRDTVQGDPWGVSRFAFPAGRRESTRRRSLGHSGGSGPGGPSRFVDLLVVGGFGEGPAGPQVQGQRGNGGAEILFQLAVETFRSGPFGEGDHAAPLDRMRHARMRSRRVVPGDGPPTAEHFLDRLDGRTGEGRIGIDLHPQFHGVRRRHGWFPLGSPGPGGMA